MLNEYYLPNVNAKTRKEYKASKDRGVYLDDGTYSSSLDNSNNTDNGADKGTDDNVEMSSKKTKVDLYMVNPS